MKEKAGEGTGIEAVEEPNTAHRTRHHHRRRIRISARLWESESVRGCGNQNQCAVMGIRIRISARLWESESESVHGYGNQNQSHSAVMSSLLRQLSHPSCGTACPLILLRKHQYLHLSWSLSRLYVCCESNPRSRTEQNSLYTLNTYIIGNSRNEDTHLLQVYM
jgi:hypothetical protein